MPSTLERRMDRVEAAIGGADESRIHYCATDTDAERVWSEAVAAGKKAPMCFVTGNTSDPAVIEGETVGEMLARVAAQGRRIHDPRPEGYTNQNTGLRFWHPPRFMR